MSPHEAPCPSCGQPVQEPDDEDSSVEFSISHSVTAVGAGVGKGSYSAASRLRFDFEFVLGGLVDGAGYASIEGMDAITEAAERAVELAARRVGARLESASHSVGPEVD